jgi:hypothetical protein
MVIDGLVFFIFLRPEALAITRLKIYVIKCGSDVAHAKFASSSRLSLTH